MVFAGGDRPPRLAPPGGREAALDDFFRHGMALNVSAALGVEDLSIGCDWVQAELD
jgi:hypothetical protein